MLRCRNQIYFMISFCVKTEAPSLSPLFHPFALRTNYIQMVYRHLIISFILTYREI